MASSIVSTQHLETYDRVSPSLFRDDFKGESVLITGGGYGIGATLARSFAEAGVARLILTGRTSDKLKLTASELQHEFRDIKVTYHTVDITKPSSVSALFSSFNGDVPNVLVNNAGFLPEPTNFKNVDLDTWWEGFEINVLGTARVTQAFLQQKSSEKRGIVITLNTFGAFGMRFPELSSYAASKAALARVVENIADDAPDFRFISVHPGMVKTAMSSKSGLEGFIPLTDVKLAANFIVWTASQEAEFLNGRFVAVNWDVDELVAKKQEILEKDLLRTRLGQSE